YLRSRLEDILASVEEKMVAWTTALQGVQAKGRRGRRPTLASCRKHAKEILGTSEKLFRWEVSRHGRGPIEVKWSRDDEAIRQRSLGFGRTLIFTDRDEWDDEAIVRAYRAKAAVEEDFRRMKDTPYLADTPEYHWTDSKIKVHQLVCFLALQLMGLLQRQLHRTGHVVTIDE
ncbi:transposase IS4 family protein, partial [mine drainage metagenome]